MAGFADLLGSLVQNGLSRSGSSRASNMFGAGGGGSLNDIVGNLSNMLGGGSGTGQTGQSGLGGLLGDVIGSLGDNKAALGGIGALGGALLGGGTGSAKGAIGGGALAMLAGLAMSALKKSGQQPPQPPALMEHLTSQQEQELEDDANILIRAMINAAKADGAIDNQELQNIVGKIEEGGITQEERDFFEAEASKPLDLDGVIASASARPDLGPQIYAASLLAIEVDTKEEEFYMQQLAEGLGLDPATVQYIENSLGLSV